ncbi:peptidase [Streptomyces sp. NPDC003035]|uniref:peptidase n=1 Tax=Streptomyces sp. NPDC003035 TaxID=3364676 RepID=UPI00368725DB
MRRLTTALAAAGVLAATGLGVGLGAGPAYAADPEFALSGPAEVGLRPYPASGEPQSATVDIGVTNPSEDEENGGFYGDVTYTFDLSALTGVADVRFDGEGGGSSECKITGTTGVCTDSSLWPGLNSVARLQVTAAKGSAVGATGDIKITGKAEGATFTSLSTKVTVGGPDLVMQPLGLDAEVTPGQSRALPVSVANHGTSAVDGILVTFLASHGLRIPETYSNCDYATRSGEYKGYQLTICQVDGTIEPGAVYEFAQPTTLKAAPHAYLEDFVARVTEDTPQQRAAQRGSETFTRGTGAVLTLKRKTTAAARTADLDPWNNQQEQGFRAKNTADFVAYGASVEKAAAGETVKATVGFRNQGPAWVGYLRSQESIGHVAVVIPQGARVTAKPDGCRGVTAGGDWREQQLGAPRYHCSLSHIVFENEDRALTFEMKVEKVIANATGTVAVENWPKGHPALDFDPSMANNTAKLVLNGTAGSGTSGGGSTGGSAGGSAGGSQGTTGGSSASGGAGSATGGAATNGASSTGGGTAAQGGLASTGSTVLLTGAAAATALVAGGAFVLVTRRRAAARQG